MRRAKVQSSSWRVVQPGNYCSGRAIEADGGGNDTGGAFDEKGRESDSGSRQAVTRVNAEQAPSEDGNFRSCIGDVYITTGMDHRIVVEINRSQNCEVKQEK